MKSDKLPKVMSLELASVGSENLNFENGKRTTIWVLSWKVSSSSLLEAILAAASITHLKLQLNCRQLSCIVGNVGARF